MLLEGANSRAEESRVGGGGDDNSFWFAKITGSSSGKWNTVSWRLDVLDMLFLGWLLVAFIIVAGVNLYLRCFGYPRRKPAPGFHGSASLLPGGGESTQWINAALAWFHSHCHDTPHLVDSWIHAVNEELDKSIDDYSVKVNRVDHASHVPKIHGVQVEGAGSGSNMTLSAAVEAQEIILDISATSVASPARKLSSEATIARLAGQLKIVCAKNIRDEIQANICFFSAPEMDVKLQPRKIDGSFNLAAIQQQLKQAVSNALTTYNLTGRNDHVMKYSDRIAPDVIAKERFIPTKAAVHEYVESSKKSGTAAAGYSRGKWILVKVIKANGLGDRDFGCAGPYCEVRIDEPEQHKKTSVVQNTVNPFWDEQFILEITDRTKQVEFDVFDQDPRKISPEFLGRADVHIAELMRMPSSNSRQLLPLTGKPGAATSGSVTVECLLVDAPEKHLAGMNDLDLAYRTDNTGSTMTTATMDRPYSSAREGEYRDTAEGSAFTPTRSLGAHEASIGSAQHSPGSSTLTRPSLMVTSPSGNDTLTNQPTTDRLYYDYPTTSTSPTSTATDATEKHQDKKKTGFAAAFKRKFQRKPKSRSMSADRSSSLREGSHLQPPGTHARTSEHTEVPENGLRKKRSSSFSSSLRKLFKGKKKDNPDGSGPGHSREGSVSRHSTRSAQGALAFDTHHAQAYNGPPSQDIPRDLPEDGDFPYSSSLPARPAPIHGQYYPHS